jgi:NAD-dependent SIR2 family protein deacetylase
MRFVPDGPDIPNQLIKEWRAGEVLFLAGAGVSAPSKLPLFEGLALGVYELLNDPLFKVLDDAKDFSQPARREKVRDATNLSADARVESDLFFERQYDRLFSALEKRIDPDLLGRPKTRKVRKAVEDILSGKKHSPSHTDLLQLSQAPNSSGDRSKSLSCRIVTTNFDLLFEAAWRKQFGADAISFDARMAPRPGAHNFEGIIHLHGSLTDNPNQLGNYVLSSRDFARVYLRSGVIGNYVYDLIRRYRVVLIGYSADDPPMRYLMDAIGEDASLFDDMRKPFAITDWSVAPDEPAAEIDEAVWRAKEINPIFYKRGADKTPYLPLWDSIHEWANWSRDDTAWVERQLEENTRIKRAEASPFQRGLVQDLLAVLSPDELEKAVSFLSGKRVDFGWIETVSAAIDAAKPSKEGTRR